MKENHRKRLGDLLVTSEIISEEQLAEALEKKNRDEKLGDYLIKEGLITEQQLIEVLEFQLGIPHIHLNQYAIDLELTKLVPKELAKRANIMPIRKDRNKLLIAMSDPMDYFAIEEVRMATGCQIETSIASKADLFRTISKYYDLQESMEAALSDLPTTVEETALEELDEDSPIVRLVNQIIMNAIAQHASDIHFDPQENELRIRYRIDGILIEERSLPKHMQNVITARIKIMGGLNITENRVPQDGRIKTVFNMRAVDLRLSTLPTVYGEKIVMRILDIGSAMKGIEQLGFSEQGLTLFKQMVVRPNGIILITGPTGSGKSSTLYTTLNYLNSEEVNIITIEDPVEYHLDGINQIQVKEEVGLTFAAGLRSILRQDPDIIMVGEIRDQETAKIAVRSSLTGHLVFSTLHTNSAPESISRLLDMGVEPFLLSASLIGVVAQRLVRRNCRSCAEPIVLTENESILFQQYGLSTEKVMKGRGCPTCNNTGYRGRLAIHEVLPIHQRVKEMITSDYRSIQAFDMMKETGLATLLEDGLKKVSAGLTTVEEVLKVTTTEEEGLKWLTN